MKRYRFLQNLFQQRGLWLAAVLLGTCAALIQTIPQVKGVPSNHNQNLDAPSNTTATSKWTPKPYQTAATTGPEIRPGYEYVHRPAALKFEETAPGTYEIKGPAYQASLSDKEGLSYSPRLDARLLKYAHEGSTGTQNFRVRLDRIQCGDRLHYDRTVSVVEDVAVNDVSGGISFWRAEGIDEYYHPRGDGVEQVFKLDQRLEGEGDLEFTCALELKNLKAAPARQGRGGGIAFQDVQGLTAMRYGQVVVRDAAQDGCVIEPHLNAKGDQIVFSVPKEFLKRAVYPVEVDPLIGGDFFVTDVSVAVSQPTISASSSNFLVVWNDYRTSPSVPQVVASLVSPTGLASKNFLLSNLAAIPQPYRNQRISVASDGTHWLVVWPDDRAVGAGLRGALVLPSGAVLDGDDFLIAPTTGAVHEDPLVTYNGLEFVVAWTDTPPSGGSSQVLYTRVTSAKVVGNAAVVPTVIAPISQSLLFLAPQKPSGDTLLVYRENGELPAATRSVRIATDGSIKDAGGTILFKELLTDGGYGRPIGATYAGGEWQLLSTFDQRVDSSIYLHRLSDTGVITPPSGIFAEMGLGATGSTSELYAPAFAGVNEWLFLRNERISNVLYHIIGKRVTYAGVDRDPVPFQVDTGSRGVLRDAVAAQITDRFLAVWLDGRSGSTASSDSNDVAGAIIDSTVAGSTDTSLVAQASASPTSGEAPMVVAFDAGLSKGTYDTLLWDFGDGTTGNTATVSKTYSRKGTYFATLYLTKAGYTVSDRIVISVGTGQGTNTGGTPVGTPLQNSPGMVTNLFVGQASVVLNFSTAKQDSVVVTGILNPSLLSADLTGKNATINVGGFSTTVSLDAKGQSKSSTVNFGVSNTTGAFAFGVIGADIQALMDPLGLINHDVKPARPVVLPITVSVDTFSENVSVSASYTAALKLKGIATYAPPKLGSAVSGSLRISSFAAAEDILSKTNKLKVHTYSIKGYIVRPNGALFTPAATGFYNFSIGNATISVPVAQFSAAGSKLKFVGKPGISGLKTFTIDSSSGIFTLQLVKITAGGDGSSGLFVAQSGAGITKVDLNLSFSFDLLDGNFSTGRYLFIARKDINTKIWIPR